ncbi:MAG: hypothetical protein J6Q21_03830 [Alistipes sp.]|nr:hypothetical protein [Alistipes sp.]
MKKCPKCDERYDDNLAVCPACGSDYIEASIDSIAAPMAEAAEGEEASTFDSDEVTLQALEGEMFQLENLITPSMRQTFARMAHKVWAGAMIFMVVASLLIAAPILYIATTGIAVLFVLALLRKGKTMTKSETDVAVLSRIFEDDMSRMKSTFVEGEAVNKRIAKIRQRIDDSREAIDKAHKANRRRIAVFIAAGAVLLVAGVGVLGYAKYNAEKAAAEYEALPEWVKLRDAYLESEYNDEFAGGEARPVVVETMLEAGVVAEAEEFFFEHCMGMVGDYDCAVHIVKYYNSVGDKEAKSAFVGKLSLRYASDNQKIKSL